MREKQTWINKLLRGRAVFSNSDYYTQVDKSILKVNPNGHHWKKMIVKKKWKRVDTKYESWEITGFKRPNKGILKYHMWRVWENLLWSLGKSSTHNGI